MDKERQVYKLKEAALADVLAGALGLHKDTSDYRKLVEWRKERSGNFAGNVQEARSRRARPRGEPCRWR